MTSKRLRTTLRHLEWVEIGYETSEGEYTPWLCVSVALFKSGHQPWPFGITAIKWRYCSAFL